jgi:outer membrane immunogenic protein
MIVATAAFANEAVVPAVSAPSFPDGSVVTASLRGTDTDWTGLQVGISYGYSKATDTFPDQTDGDTAGIFAAYNHQFGKAVVGVEAEHLNVDNRYEVIPVKLKTLSSLKLRGGIALDRFLVYGTAGISYADIEVFGEDWGYVFGGGFDYMLTDHIVLGAQYAHHIFKGYNDFPIDGDADVAVFRAAFMF